MKIKKTLSYFLSFALAMFFCNGVNGVSLETLDVDTVVHQENYSKFHFVGYGLKESEIEENEDGDFGGLKLKLRNPPFLQPSSNQFKKIFSCSRTDFKVFLFPSANKTPLFLLFENFRI